MEKKKQMNMYDALMKLEELKANVLERIDRWIEVRDNGTNDSFWEDGSSLHLIRNHMIYYKSQIKEICDLFCISYPNEYELPLPPEVPYTWMSDLNTERAKKMKEIYHRDNLIHYEVEYDPFN